MIVTELIKMAKLSATPIFPLQALSACCEEDLTTIVRWWKMGPLVGFLEGDGLETR